MSQSSPSVESRVDSFDNPSAPGFLHRLRNLQVLKYLTSG
jgi:hypothetical protein